MGGVPTVLGHLLPGLNRDIEVLFLDPLESGLASVLEARGVRVVRRGMPGLGRSMGWGRSPKNIGILLRLGPRYLAYAGWLAGYLRRERVDAICCSFVKSAMVALPAAAAARVPLVYYNHGVADVRVLRTLPFLLVGRCARMIVTVSADTQRRLWSGGVPAARTAVVPNGLPPPDPQDHPLAHRERPVVAFVGNLHPLKRVEDLVRAVGVVLNRGVDCELWVIGDSPPGAGDAYRVGLENLAATTGLGDRVCFWGHRPDVATLMGQIDIVVLPSEYESFGMTLLEAMRAGKPCIATATGGVPEVVRHGDTGLLYPVGDVGALCDGLCMLLADGGVRERMGNAGRCRWYREFTLERQVHGMLEVLGTVVSRQRHPS